MASIFRNSKGQIVVSFYYDSIRYQKPFRDSGDAEAFKATIEQELSKANSAKKPTPIIQAFIAERESKAKTPKTASTATTAKADMERAWERFHAWKATNNTKDAMREVERSWEDFLAYSGVTDLATVTEDTVNRWKAHLLAHEYKPDKRYSASTVNNQIRNIGYFFDWAHKQGIITKNPMTEIKKLKVDKQRKPFLTQLECDRIIHEALNIDWNIAFFCALGIYQGLRKGEIHAAKWGWISDVNSIQEPPKVVKAVLEGLDNTVNVVFIAKNKEDIPECPWEPGTPFLDKDGNPMPSMIVPVPKHLVKEYIDGIPSNLRKRFKIEITEFGKSESSIEDEFSHHVLTISAEGRFRVKNRKSRSMPLHASLLRLIRQYPGAIDSTAYIINPSKTTWNGKDRYTFSKPLKKVLKAAGVETVNRFGFLQPVSPHVFRYTFVTHLLNNPKYTRFQVQEWAGHSDAEMTEHYGHVFSNGKTLEF